VRLNSQRRLPLLFLLHFLCLCPLFFSKLGGGAKRGKEKSRGRGMIGAQAEGEWRRLGREYKGEK
jgi:hypothetical protein